MICVEKLKDMYYHQTRNGRDTIYLPVATIKELDSNFKVDDSQEYMYVDSTIVLKWITKLERSNFRDTLKYNVDIVEYTKQRIEADEQEREI